jgi:hypothetical protein
MSQSSWLAAITLIVCIAAVHSSHPRGRSKKVDIKAQPGDASQVHATGSRQLLQNGCFCATIFDPVCGANGKTYSNACQAKCSNVTVASTGACEDGSQQSESPAR